ncbi:MAG: DUF58 domain-containing protein [Planctomycetaceae bacterium]|jgi:uncharacterized protein (DUF58 family)|nr:DUF58 domain-containing protein [Planctomycetaceae bacterium]
MNVAPQNQLTSLLDNSVLARLERLRLQPNRRQTNRTQGEHVSGRGGSSTEFADYRNYVPGDDVRFVDWNIFARLNRPYLKLYQYEEEMHVAILVDASSSMRFENKFHRARELAAAFGVIGLMGTERVSVHVAGAAGDSPQMLPPCSGRANIRRLFGFLEQVDCGGDSGIDESIEAMLRRHRGRGVVVLLSDFLTPATLSRPLNLLHSAGLEIFALQVLGPSEIDPELGGDLRLVDSEHGEVLDVSSIGELLGLYREHREQLEVYLRRQCHMRNGRFLSTSSEDPIQQVLFDLLLRQGWVK